MGAALVVANVSRLTRSPDFMTVIVDAGVEVRFCDLPQIEAPAGKFMLRQMLAVAELEAGMIGERTRKGSGCSAGTRARCSVAIGATSIAFVLAGKPRAPRSDPIKRLGALRILRQSSQDCRPQA